MTSSVGVPPGGAAGWTRRPWWWLYVELALLGAVLLLALRATDCDCGGGAAALALPRAPDLRGVSGGGGGVHAAAAADDGAESLGAPPLCPAPSPPACPQCNLCPPPLVCPTVPEAAPAVVREAAPSCPACPAPPQPPVAAAAAAAVCAAPACEHLSAALQTAAAAGAGAEPPPLVLPRHYFALLGPRVRHPTPGITVILTVFKRGSNFPAQLASLDASTLRPAKVLVYQTGNHSDVAAHFAGRPDVGHLLTTGHDFMFHGRFQPALQVDTDVTCIMDDDNIVQARWFERVRATLDAHGPNTVVAATGRTAVFKPPEEVRGPPPPPAPGYTRPAGRPRRVVHAGFADPRPLSPATRQLSDVAADTPVDFPIHHYCFRTTLARWYWALPHYTWANGEDMAFGAATAIGAGARVIVPRQSRDEGTSGDSETGLGRDGLGASTKADHESVRTELLHHWVRVGRWGGRAGGWAVRRRSGLPPSSDASRGTYTTSGCSVSSTCPACIPTRLDHPPARLPAGGPGVAAAQPAGGRLPGPRRHGHAPGAVPAGRGSAAAATAAAASGGGSRAAAAGAPRTGARAAGARAAGRGDGGRRRGAGVRGGQMTDAKRGGVRVFTLGAQHTQAAQARAARCVVCVRGRVTRSVPRRLGRPVRAPAHAWRGGVWSANGGGLLRLSPCVAMEASCGK